MLYCLRAIKLNCLPTTPFLVYMHGTHLTFRKLFVRKQRYIGILPLRHFDVKRTSYNNFFILDLESKNTKVSQYPANIPVSSIFHSATHS